MMLPKLGDNIIPRPNQAPYEESYMIPDDVGDRKKFWKNFYKGLNDVPLRFPTRRNIQKYIHPYFGYFGYRVHPVTKKAGYFHVGVSLELDFGRKIYPVLPGILEYAGYGAINGHYVLISHPDIQTEDGYVFHSMYCHLKKPLVRFNSYQKMLREISLGSYPKIPVSTKQVLGTASTSGVSREQHPGMYLQFSFRKFDQAPIVIDPMMMYNGKRITNKSADITDSNEIEAMFQEIEKKEMK